jgi:hypothetical protein
MATMATGKEKDQEEELIIVEDEKLLSTDVDDEDDDDDHDEAPEQDDDEDDRLKKSDDDGRESIRERRRKEKIERKERREQAIKRDKIELEFLRKQNETLERRVTVQEQRAHIGDLNSFDTAIAQATKEAEMAERIIAKAIESGNGDDVTQALRYRDQSIAQINNLHARKQQTSQTSYTPPQSQIDDRTMHYAQKFISDNPWYDSQGRDEDSAIVIAIDQSLAKDGYDPKGEDYWTELRKRVSRRLPERVDKKEQRNPRGGPNVGSGREHAPTSTRKEIYISPERKQALVDAGVWDDPVLRNRYVKRYAEYDKEHRNDA